MVDSLPEASLTLLPEVEARAALRSPIVFRVLRPPYAAIGTGTLRALRVVEFDDRTELVAGYDGYERIDMRERPAPGP